MDPQTLATYVQRYPWREIPDEHGNPTGQVMTGPVRLAFANLAKPRKRVNPRTGEKFMAWGAALLIPAASDAAAGRTVAARAAAEKFGPNWRNVSGLRNPFKPQDALAGKYDGFEAGAFYIDTESRFPVPVVGARRGPDGEFPKLDATNGDLVYSGMWVLANLSVYTYDTTGNKGVKFGLRAVQKLADDSEFKGGDASSAFGDIDDSGIVKHGGNGAVAAAVNGAAKAPAEFW